MEKEGTKRVKITRVDDKHQITAVLAGSLAGDFLSSPPTHIQRYYKAMSTNSSIFPQNGMLHIAITTGQMNKP